MWHCGIKNKDTHVKVLFRLLTDYDDKLINVLFRLLTDFFFPNVQFLKIVFDFLVRKFFWFFSISSF